MFDRNVIPIERPRSKPGDLPPHSLDAEASVIADVLAGGGTGASLLRGMLPPEAFFGEAHRVIAEAFRSLDAEGKPTDMISMAARLSGWGKAASVGGMAGLVAISDETPVMGDVEAHGRIVFELWQVRRLGSVAATIAAYCRGDVGEPRAVLDRARAAIGEITDVDPTLSSGTSLGASMTAEYKALVFGDVKRSSGLSTGLGTIDDVTTGMLPGQLWVFAGRPGNGKTSMAMQIAVGAARAKVGDELGLGVCVFTLEMDHPELSRRMMCSEAWVDSRKLRTGAFSHDEYARIHQAHAHIASLPVWLEDKRGIDIRDLKSKARLRADLMRKAGTPLGLVVVDYLQLVKVGDSKGRQLDPRQVVAIVARELKNLAGELGVPVLALCQMNRAIESRHGGWPRLSDLSESGEIENAADLVMFLHRPVRERAVIVACIEKQRSGPVQARVPLKFYDYCTMFEAFEPGQDTGVSLQDAPQGRKLDPHTGKVL